jgi:hypothetical protein
MFSAITLQLSQSVIEREKVLCLIMPVNEFKSLVSLQVIEGDVNWHFEFLSKLDNA